MREPLTKFNDFLYFVFFKLDLPQAGRSLFSKHFIVCDTNNFPTAGDWVGMISDNPQRIHTRVQKIRVKYNCFCFCEVLRNNNRNNGATKKHRKRRCGCEEIDKGFVVWFKGIFLK